MSQYLKGCLARDILSDVSCIIKFFLCYLKLAFLFTCLFTVFHPKLECHFFASRDYLCLSYSCPNHICNMLAHTVDFQQVLVK